MAAQPAEPSEEIDFRAVLRFPLVYWVLTLSCVLVYIDVLAFNNNSSTFITQKFLAIRPLWLICDDEKSSYYLTVRGVGRGIARVRCPTPPPLPIPNAPFHPLLLTPGEYNPEHRLCVRHFLHAGHRLADRPVRPSRRAELAGGVVDHLGARDAGIHLLLPRGAARPPWLQL